LDSHLPVFINNPIVYLLEQYQLALINTARK